MWVGDHARLNDRENSLQAAISLGDQFYGPNGNYVTNLHIALHGVHLHYALLGERNVNLAVRRKTQGPGGRVGRFTLKVEIFGDVGHELEPP